MTKKLVLKKQDPKSKQYFTSEKKYLLKKLDKKLIYNLFHFGSTAVPKLSGKGFIDIYLVLKSKRALATISNILTESAGYTKPENAGTTERKFFWREKRVGGKKVIFHIHVSWKSAKEWKDAVLFAQYLIKNPKVAERYEELKYQWAEKVKWNRKAYLKKKTRYIRSVVKKAKSEKSRKF